MTTIEPPGMSAADEYAPSVGRVFAVTLTVKEAFEKRL